MTVIKIIIPDEINRKHLLMKIIKQRFWSAKGYSFNKFEKLFDQSCSSEISSNVLPFVSFTYRFTNTKATIPKKAYIP